MEFFPFCTAIVLTLWLAPACRMTAAPTPTFIRNSLELAVASAVATDVPYSADRTGAKDSTAAIQRALDLVAAAHGGVVYLPEGRYRIDGSLRIGYGTTLMGVSGGLEHGTILEAREKRAPLLDMRNPETGLISLAIWYPDQKPEKIEPYPPAVLSQGSTTLRQVVFYNAYEGIDLERANACVIENISGTVLHRGIVVPESTEFSWMHDVHFSNETWRKAAAVLGQAPLSAAQCALINDFTEHNLIGLELQRIDCMAICHYAADNAGTAVLMRKNPKFPEEVFGFGGVVADFRGKRVEEGWAPWYYSMHYANLDNVPEVAGFRYGFSVVDPLGYAQEMLGFKDVTQAPYSAVGDGKWDDTRAIQQALADAAGHRGIVYLRQGEYKITAPLIVPPGVELRGPMGTGKARDMRETCTLAVYCGKDTAHPETDPAAITLMNSAGVRGFTVAHPEQDYDARHLHPFPYSIRGEGSDVWIIDMMLLNSFNGIDLGSTACDRHLVRGVWGTTFQHGLTVGGNSTSGKLERICFSCGPWTEATGRLGRKISAAGNAAMARAISGTNIAFSFGDCQRESAWGLFAYEPRIHFHFRPGTNGGCQNADFWQSMHDVGGQCNVLAEDGKNINLLGYFGTGSGGGRHNWLETSPAFAGPLNIFGRTIQPTFQNHPFDHSQHINFFDETSWTTGRPALGAGTLSFGTPAARAVDRNNGTLWEAKAGGLLDVDLGESRLITRFALESAGFYLPQNLNTLEAELWVGDDGTNFRKAAVMKTGGASRADIPVPPVQARFVRLRVTKPGADGIIRIASFDVY